MQDLDNNNIYESYKDSYKHQNDLNSDRYKVGDVLKLNTDVYYVSWYEWPDADITEPVNLDRFLDKEDLGFPLDTYLTNRGALFKIVAIDKFSIRPYQLESIDRIKGRNNWYTKEHRLDMYFDRATSEEQTLGTIGSI